MKISFGLTPNVRIARNLVAVCCGRIGPRVPWHAESFRIAHHATCQIVWVELVSRSARPMPGLQGTTSLTVPLQDLMKGYARQIKLRDQDNLASVWHTSLKQLFSGSDTRHLLWQNARSRGSALECQSNYSCTVTSRINSNKSCCRESLSGLHFTFMTLSTQDRCVRGAPMIPLTHDAVLYDVAFGHVNTRLTEQVLLWWSHAVYESGLVLLTETDRWLPTMARLDLRNALC